MENLENAQTDTVHVDNFLAATEDFIVNKCDFQPNVVYTLFIFFVSFFILAFCLFHGRWRRWIFRHLKWIAGSVFLVGVVVYMLGFNWEGSEDNLFVLFLRASVSSLEMFVSESDLIEVKEELKRSHFYMFLFSVTHFLAVFVSAIFIVRLFGLRLMSMFRLWWNGLFRQDKKLYVFWGVNEKTLTVAESLFAERKSLITEKSSVEPILFVFVKIPCEKHSHSSRFTFSHFFHTVDDGIEEYVERIEKLNILKIKTFITVANRGVDMELVEANHGHDVFKEFGLNNLGRCMRRRGETEFFFMSDDEQKNVEAVCVMKSFVDKPNYGYGISSIFCHARNNRINSGVLGCGTKDSKIHLVDSSMLSVWQIKKDLACQPVRFVELDETTGTVSSIFTAMIIGFGETGRDMLRFLYEFGSFIKDTKTGNDGRDNVFEQAKKIYVVDKYLEELKTKFLVNAPALVGNNSIEWLDGISTHDMHFWDKMREIIKQLNYVVVAVDNDQEAAFVATQVFEFAHRYRDDFYKFKIYVRLRDKKSRRILEQISKYRINVDGKESVVINVFGTDEDVFSYNNLSHLSKKDEVESFEERYDVIYNEISKNALPGKPKEVLDAVSKDFKMKYTHEQNLSNVCHVYTKQALAGIAEGENEDKRKHLVAVTTRDSRNEYPHLVSEEDKVLFNNLAYCEHVRWNAKMELMGFVYDNKRSMKRKTHECLLSCNDLIRSKDPYVVETLKYDKGIVELSIKLK